MLLGNDSFNSHIRRRNFELTAFKSGPCFPPYMLINSLNLKVRPWPLLSSPRTFQQSNSALSRAEWQIPSPDCKVLSQNRFHVCSDSSNMHRCGCMEDWPTRACSKVCLAFHSPWSKTPHNLYWVRRAHSESELASRWQITWAATATGTGAEAHSPSQRTDASHPTHKQNTCLRGGTSTQPKRGTKFILLSSQKPLLCAVKEF